MTLLLYYSISSKLSNNEIANINQRVNKNRQNVYFFIKGLPLNSTNKMKKLGLYITFIIVISQPLSSFAAVIVPLPTPMNTL